MDELIKRARELAALAEKATPGPWEWVQGIGTMVLCRTDEGLAVEWVIKENLSHSDPSHSGGPCPTKENAELIAAAPEMAKLLGKMAEELDHIREQLKWHCRAVTCGNAFYNYRRHGPNCLAEEILGPSWAPWDEG